MRVAAYVDGYNVYHSIIKTRQDRHKWCDLRALLENFCTAGRDELTAVHYFSAYATWKPNQMARHRAYTSALEATGVTLHMSRFSEKDRACKSCGASWTSHEEKETDVKLAVTLLAHGVQDLFDRALIVSRDSDLVPAARAFKDLFPHKELKVVAPYAAGHSSEMLQICDGKHKIQLKHLEKYQLPASLTACDGTVISRPIEYSSLV